MFIVVAALQSGLGIWATHFIAMLAYEPRIPITYDVPTTLLSVLAAIVFSGIGWTVAMGVRRVTSPIFVVLPFRDCWFHNAPRDASKVDCFAMAVLCLGTDGRAARSVSPSHFG